MKLKKEPVDIDFIIESKPWSDAELEELRIIMKKANIDVEKSTKRREKRAAVAKRGDWQSDFGSVA